MIARAFMPDRMTAVMAPPGRAGYAKATFDSRREKLMPSRITLGSLLVATVMTIGTVAQTGADPALKWAAINLRDTTMIAGAFISGPVVFVHDDAKMAAGEPCTTVHRFEAGRGTGEELVAFHCKPRWGKAPEQFTQSVTTTPDGLRVMTEYQFAGDKEAHAIPRMAH